MFLWLFGPLQEGGSAPDETTRGDAEDLSTASASMVGLVIAFELPEEDSYS